jgi:putative ABC transport system permease protein
MPDWTRFVRDHFPGNRLKRDREEEIIADLGQQLEDFYQEAMARGASEEEAAEFARCQVPDWETLVHNISGSSPGSCQPVIDRWHDQAETVANAGTGGNLLVRLLADLKYDLAHGIRILLKNPGFTATAMITLALGIGINTAVFSVVNGIIHTPQQYPDSKTLVYVWGTRNPDIRSGDISAADAADWQMRCRSFSEFSVFRSQAKTWRGAVETERVRTLETTASLFAMMGIGASRGRLFPVPGDSAAAPAVVVTDDFWRTKLGADPGVLGKTYALDGVHHTIVGVLEPTRKLMQLTVSDVDVLLPLARDALNASREERSYQALARLKQDVPLAAAQAEMDGIAANLARSYPDTNARSGVRLESLKDRLVRPSDRLMSVVLLIAVAAVLLIACINLANMLIAKATQRTRDFAIRLALGAGRMRIIRQLLAESLLLALAGGALGFWLAQGAVKIFLQSIEGAPFTLQDLGPNINVLLYTLGISLATSAVFGLAPAAMLSRISVADAIKEAGAAGLPGLSRARLREYLVVAELAIGLPLLICCGLAVRNVQSLGTIELGFDSRNLVAMYIELPQFRYPAKERWPVAFQEIVARMQTLPAVKAAGAALSFPIGGAHYRMSVRARAEGSLKQKIDDSIYLSCQPVTPGYFEAMEIPLIAGRKFEERDQAGSLPVAMINRQMAISYFENGNAVGRWITLDPGMAEERRVMIAGVVGNSGRGIFGQPATPEIYLPHAQSPMPGMVVVVRSTRDPVELVPELRRCLRELDPDIPLSEVQTVPEILHRWLRDDRALALFLAILSALSLALAALGLYGVMSYAVNQRTHEIGIRMALGADAGKVIGAVLRQCLALSLTGIGIGFLISLPVALLLGSQFYGVSGIDPVTFAGVSVLLLAVGLLAGYFPARRAARVDPIQALRHE